MKRTIALILMLTLLLSCLPGMSLAAKQMEDDVPVWTERRFVNMRWIISRASP